MNSVSANSFCQILLVGICLHCFAFVQPIGTDSGRREMEAEETMTTIEMVQSRGYPIEPHLTITADRYILTLHRIPHGRQRQSGIYKEGTYQKRPAILFVHGFGGSSIDWVINDETHSAGYIFADAGFDVWLGNVRGNVYSRGHMFFNYQTDKSYWNFSWDEMAQFDLPAMVNYILAETKQPYLYYVGYSQGVTMMLAQLAMPSDHNFPQKIRKFFALGPTSRVANIKGVLDVISKILRHNYRLYRRLFGKTEFLPQNKVFTKFELEICSIEPISKLCANILFLIAGPNSHQLDDSRVPVYLGHYPAGASTQTFIHYSQLVLSKKFQMYDYGSDSANEQNYGQSTPPLYDMSRVNVPVHLFHSDQDWLADPTDVTHALLEKIPRQFLVQVKNLKYWNHFDFILGQNAASELYSDMVETLRNDMKMWIN